MLTESMSSIAASQHARDRGMGMSESLGVAGGKDVLTDKRDRNQRRKGKQRKTNLHGPLVDGAYLPGKVKKSSMTKKK